MASEASDATGLRAPGLRRFTQSMDLSCEESAEDLGTFESPCWQSERTRIGTAQHPGDARLSFEVPHPRHSMSVALPHELKRGKIANGLCAHGVRALGLMCKERAALLNRSMLSDVCRALQPASTHFCWISLARCIATLTNCCWPVQELIAHAGRHNEQELRAMLSIEHEYQAPVDYMSSAGAIGPEHRYFLISWLVMVRVTIVSLCMTASLQRSNDDLFCALKGNHSSCHFAH